MIINQYLALTHTIVDILPFPRICASAVAVSQLATFIAPKIFPIGQSSFSDPEKQAEVEKIKRVVEQVKQKLGLENLNVNVRISDMAGSKITVLGSKYALGGPLLIIGSDLIFNTTKDRIIASASYKYYQEVLASIKDEQVTNVSLSLHKMTIDDKNKFLNLHAQYKNILSDDELELKIAENISQIVNHTALLSLSSLGILWSFSRGYTSFLRLLSIKGNEFAFSPDNYLESAINYIRANTKITVPARKLESICRFFLTKWMINSNPSPTNDKIINDNKIFPGQKISLKKKFVSYIGPNNWLAMHFASAVEQPKWQKYLSYALLSMPLIPMMTAAITAGAWRLPLVAAVALPTLYALNYVRKTKPILKVTECFFLTFSLIELTHFMFDHKFVEDQLLNLELHSFSFIKPIYQEQVKPLITLVESTITQIKDFVSYRDTDKYRWNY